MTYPVVTFGGRTCLGASSVAWAFRDGVVPTVQEYDFPPDVAEVLLSGPSQPMQLVITGAGNTLTVNRLYVIGEVPGDSPKMRRVQVADRRYWWAYAGVLKRYNMRRGVGVKRIASTGTDEVDPIVQDVWYKPWSTKDENGKVPWTAWEILEDILEGVLSKEAEFNSGALDYSVPDTNFGAMTGQPVEDLEIRGNGAEALQIALARLPETTIRVDASGRVMVYSRIDGGEVAPITSSGYESVGKGHVIHASNAQIRPRSIRFHFQREIELRFDATEAGDPSGSFAKKPDDRVIHNVLPVPDYQLMVAGRKLDQGTWITIPEAIDAWGSIPNFGAIDFVFLRRALVPYRDVWAAARQDGMKVPDADWVSRLGALAQHYRQTFRIPKRWMDRMHSVRAYRIGIVDQETAARAPALAFCNFCRIASQRRVAAGAMDTWCMNVEGFPDGAGDPPAIRSTTKPAPATVSVLDEDQGIIRISFLADTVRMFDSVLPGRVFLHGSSQPGPTQRLRDAGVIPITFDALPENARDSIPELEANWRVATILTVLAGAPNDLRQCHMIEVKPDEVRNNLPAFARHGVSRGQSWGPSLDVLVTPSPQTVALVAWKDDWKDRIDQSFGIGGDPENPPDLTKITINAGQDDAPLNIIARAMAAGLYASFSDRYQGSKTVPLRPGTTLDGWMREVVHSVGTKGEVETRMVLREGGPVVDWISFLPPELQAFVTRKAQP